MVSVLIPILCSLPIIYSVIAYEVRLGDAFVTWLKFSALMGLFLIPPFWWIYRKISSVSEKLNDDDQGR